MRLEVSVRLKVVCAEDPAVGVLEIDVDHIPGLIQDLFEPFWFVSRLLEPKQTHVK